MSCERFGFLKNTIKVIAVDDETSILETYGEVLGAHGLYAVDCVRTASEADELIRSSGPYYLCLMDLGLDDLDGDDLALIARHGNSVPVIVITGATSVSKGYALRRFPLVGVLEKPASLLERETLCLLRQGFLTRLVTPGGTPADKPAIDVAARALRTKRPKTVSSWAREANLHHSYLRKLWESCFSTQLKFVLFLHNLYYYAGLCFDGQLLGDDQMQREALGGYSPAEYELQLAYLREKQDLFTRSFGLRWNLN
jgi:CheY-like chemotaxis protein